MHQERSGREATADDIRIDTPTYKRCVSAFSLVERHLGINIRLHPAADPGDDGPGDATGQLEQGDILVFNHFARFETIIPAYLLFRQTGRYCRTLASSELFDGSPAFTRFLKSIGGVPNDMNGVLAFLAAEILRGRKVVIFPEGGMIKDRRVRGENGELSILSPSTGKERKHHSGAAAVALVLEIFKERIRSVSRLGESERLGRWAGALGLDSVETLIARASRPTRIVPANITFHPIRADENVLTRGADLLFRGLALQLKEELLIEGNILLRDTDMDIRLAPAVSPDIRWSWWERQLLAWSFSQIDSLDHLFDVNASPNKLIDRLASSLVHHNIRRLRDHCMVEMYRHTTVNMAHVASALLYRLYERDRRTLPLSTFRDMVYAVIKKAQEVESVFLHRGLLDPERYGTVREGGAADLERLVSSAALAGLLRIEDNALHILDRLCEHGPDTPVRLSHTVRVYANEVEPIDAVGNLVDEAADMPPGGVDPRALSAWYLDDELRALARTRAHYAKPRYDDINALETATASAAPYLHLPADGRSTGVVLVHGFLSSPAELAEFGRELADAGFPVMGVRLSGHGTSPHDLMQRSGEEWLASIRRGIAILRPHVRQFALVGFSMGGTLALHAASEAPEGLAGVASISAPLRLRQKTLHLAPALHGVNRLSTWAASMEGLVPFIPSQTAQPDINYQHIPVRSLIELRHAIRLSYRACAGVRVPALILQGRNDPVVEPKSAELYLARLASPEKELHWIDSDRHGIVLENVGETRSLLHAFVERLDDAGGGRSGEPPFGESSSGEPSSGTCVAAHRVIPV
ncbi:MAG: alpha/beta fold hydrolase [Geminicoccaceae bacterium]